MSDEHQNSGSGAWGCLSVGMILMGAFTINLFEGVGGADYEIKFMAIGSLVVGAAILLMVFVELWTKQAIFRLPTLHPVLAFAALGGIFYLLLF